MSIIEHGLSVNKHLTVGSKKQLKIRDLIDLSLESCFHLLKLLSLGLSTKRTVDMPHTDPVWFPRPKRISLPSSCALSLQGRDGGPALKKEDTVVCKSQERIIIPLRAEFSSSLHRIYLLQSQKLRLGDVAGVRV